MRIIFTKMEREYLAELAYRNVSSIKKGENCNWESGLNKPMDTNERVKRKRIRDKAMNGIHDLVLAEMAGIIPSKKERKGGILSLCGLFNQHSVNMNGLIQTESEEVSKWFLSQYKYEKMEKSKVPINNEENEDETDEIITAEAYFSRFIQNIME